MAEPALMVPLHAALGAVGLSWDWLRREATGIVLFGSRAAGLGSTASDWDLLCIGPRGPKPNGVVDLVWVDPGVLESSRWLGSELAMHVAAFGTPLMGSHPWIASVFTSADAVSRKMRRVIHKIRGMEAAWPVLTPTQRARHARWLRLELQRLERLQSGRPVPPTALLDREWVRARAMHAEWCSKMSLRLEIQPQRLTTYCD
jgi:hypothetical protein